MAIFIYCTMPAFAQAKRQPANTDKKDFYQLLAEANIKFTYPPGFKSIPPVNDEDFSFDYDLQLPGKDFEMWLQIKPQKQNYTSYEHTRYDAQLKLANPDSIYMDMAKANAITLTGENTDFLVRTIPPEVLARYNADAGKSYLLTLLDLPATRHYKYALILALQQNHTGTMLAICFTNEKDPDFYKNVNRACRSFRFKPQTIN